MAPEAPWYRPLYQSILAYDGPALAADVLRPFASSPASGRAWLEAFAARPGSPIPAAELKELFALYGLSRCGDVLLASLAPRPRRDDLGKRIAPPLTTADYAGFFESLGLDAFPARPGTFCPFFHEIVRVDPTEAPDAPITVTEAYWPGLMLGPMLFARAGVRVRGGARHVRQDVAEDSTMHFTYVRAYRPTYDLSRGWGSNSQWRTRFRRDYALDGTLHYNVDAAPDSDIPPDPDFTEAELQDLVRHRYFVVTPKAADDAWPYDTTVIEAAPPDLP